MTNPNALWEDMEKLNALYEELCWDHDDELVFTHDGKEVIIYNKTKEQKQWTKEQNVLMDGQQWSESLQQWVVMQSVGKSSLMYGDVSLLNDTDGSICFDGSAHR